MLRPRDTTRTTEVGIAIATPALRRAVIESLESSGRYEPVVFAPADVARGAWPREPYVAIVATPGAFRLRQRQSARRRPGAPVILVVREDEIFRERAALGIADAFVLAERLDSLPSIIVLSAHRLSVMPRTRGGQKLELDRRLLMMLPQLSARDRTVLAALAGGSGNGAIASRLGVSETTAKAYVRRIIGLLGLGSRDEASNFAAALFPGSAAGAAKKR